MSIPEEQSKEILLYCSKENLSLIVTWRVSRSINQHVLIKNWNMFFTRRFNLKYSFLLGQLIGGTKSGESRIIPIGAVSFVSISVLHNIEHLSLLDAKLLEEVKRGVQITLEVYDKLDISKYFHLPSASQESNASPPPLIEVTDSPTSDVPLISVMDNEPSSVKRSVNDQPVELYEGVFSQLSSKRSKSEVDQKTYMGGRYIVSYSNLRSSDMQPNTSSLIFDNPNKLPLCKHCSLPISENSNISLKCSQCGSCFHRACSWGHFYVATDPSNFWLCGKCLEKHIVDVFDQEVKQWKSVMVIHYDEEKQIHQIKHNQSVLYIQLRQYPVQYGKQEQLTSTSFPHSLSHDSVIENRNGCRSYRAIDYFTGFASNSYHSLPQILTFPTKRTSVSCIASVIQRRLGRNEQIELLVIPTNKSILSAVWISQERITESVKKGLTNYFSYNLFSSPLWSTILNVAEEAFYYQEFSPVLLPGMEVLSTNDISTDVCCVCHIDDGKKLLICDSCDSCFHLSCTIPKLKAKPTGKWFCQFCKTHPNDIDKQMHKDEMNCWFVGSAGKESSYKICLLPAGEELLKRQTREDDLTDHYVSLCENDPRPSPLPSLTSLKLFNYHCDELHTVSPPHSMYYNQHLLSVMNILSLYHIVHLLTTTQTDYRGFCSCVFHHFYHTSRLTGPILIIAPTHRIPLWADSIHSYTFVKVAILSANSSERKDQWAGFLGPPKGMYIGEYQVFLLPLSVYKNLSSFDKPYLSELGVSLLVFDNIFADKTSVLSSFPSSHEAQDRFRRVGEYKPSYLLFVHNFKQPCEMIPPAFVSQCSKLTDYLSKENHPREIDVNRLCKSLESYSNPLSIPPSFVSFCFEEDYGRDLHILECVHFVGVSTVQRKCLDALYLRWQFLLQNFTKTPFNQDCLISLFLEMQRIYIHPMIGGCPDSMLTQSTSWEDAFIQSSGKMLCLDYCLSCAKKNSSSFIFTVYSRSLRFCHFLEKYYKKQEQNVQCLFGVHTLQEFKKVIQVCQYNADHHIFTILILGTIPAGLSFQCPFIEEVYVHDTDMNPSLDLGFMKSSFHIGLYSPVRVIYFLYASSFEVEYFIPNSKFLSHYRSFVNNKESRFCDYLRMYLLSHNSACYSQFIQGSLNFVNVNAVKLLRLGTNHAFPANMMEHLKGIIPAFQPEITLGSIEAIQRTTVQVYLESLWTVCKSSTEVIKMCKELIDLLPPCIQFGQSLSNISYETLELCSQLDLLICHSLQRLADFNDDLPFDNETTIRKRMRYKQKNDYYNVVQPMYHILKVYLGRIRRAAKVNNYWVIVPYQDIFRKL